MFCPVCFVFLSGFLFFYFLFSYFSIAPGITLIYHQCSLCLRPPAPPSPTPPPPTPPPHPTLSPPERQKEKAPKYSRLTAAVNIWRRLYHEKRETNKQTKLNNQKKKLYQRGWRCFRVEVRPMRVWSPCLLSDVSVCSLSRVCLLLLLLFFPFLVVVPVASHAVTSLPVGSGSVILACCDWTRVWR